MYYVVKMNEDFETWDVINHAQDKDSADELLELYSQRYPHAYVDYMNEQEYSNYLKEV